MICPNGGNQCTNGNCDVCGSKINRSNSNGFLITTSILLAVIIVTAAIFLFALPTSTNISNTAKHFITAAYYTDKVLNIDNYDSYQEFKHDLDIAIHSCDELKKGTRSFLSANTGISICRTAYAADVLSELDTDAPTGYSGGYSSGAQNSIDKYVAVLQRDAVKAGKALDELNSSITEDTDDEVIVREAIKNARQILSRADRVSVVVGNKSVSFAGITELGGINAALVGGDIIIDGDTLYLGEPGRVIFSADRLGNKVAAIGSQDERGVMISTGSIPSELENGASVVINIKSVKPQATFYSGKERSEFITALSDEISRQSLGFSDAKPVSGKDNIKNTESGVYYDLQSVVGTWRYADAVINPWVTLDEIEKGAAEFSLDIHKRPSEIIMYEGKEVEQYMIFRSDGTGIMYYDVEDVGIYLPHGFWWRKEEPLNERSNIIVAQISGEVEFEWDDNLRGIMQRFQNGDYSDFAEDLVLGVFVEKNVYEEVTGTDMLYQYVGGNETSDVCIVYHRVSESTDFTY